MFMRLYEREIGLKVPHKPEHPQQHIHHRKHPNLHQTQNSILLDVADTQRPHHDCHKRQKVLQIQQHVINPHRDELLILVVIVLDDVDGLLNGKLEFWLCVGDDVLVGALVVFYHVLLVALFDELLLGAAVEDVVGEAQGPVGKCEEKHDSEGDVQVVDQAAAQLYGNEVHAPPLVLEQLDIVPRSILPKIRQPTQHDLQLLLRKQTHIGHLTDNRHFHSHVSLAYDNHNKGNHPKSSNQGQECILERDCPVVLSLVVEFGVDLVVGFL